MDNEKGYILPLTMMLAAAILLISVSASAIFVSRYSYLDTMEEGYNRESLMLYSVNKLIAEGKSTNGAFTYPEGVVRYEVDREDQLTTMILSLETDGNSFDPLLVKYKNDTKEILVWE
ncbi:competence type IV pilus minor pilin ComGG [Bacillus salacetis]|uniref:competence type IV pilus minor pilin ComGG n=1 Tax=Bacillus salacetis TaxID=2315464 RepID=UPI003B9EEE28